MQKNPFGKTGLMVSRLGFGAAPIGFLGVEQQQVAEILNYLLDNDVNVIDTAAMYHGSEELIGQAVGHRRSEYVLISKCGQEVEGIDAEAWSPELITASIDRSLQRLQTDHLDVMLLHTCGQEVLERGEAVAALVKARSAGKIRFSGYSGDNEAVAYAAALPEIDVVEFSINVCDQVNIDRLLPLAREYDLGTVAKRPIANTAWRRDELKGLYRDYARIYAERLEAMKIQPQELGFSGPEDWPEIALRFTIWLSGVHTAIVGTTNKANVEKNIRAANKGPLPEETVQKIRNAFRRAEKRAERSGLGNDRPVRSNFMEYTKLGSTGLTVSRICLGTMTYGSKKWREWVLEEEDSRPFIKRALEAGINFFDTADMYSLGRSEEILGQALKDFGPGRDRVVIATKVFNPIGDDPNQRGLSRKHIRHALDNSLRRLQTDYIDLYQIHRFDPETPMEETLEALNEAVKAGKVLYIGASSMWAWQFAQMLALSEAHGWARFVTMQNHYNLLYREEEREMNPLCVAEGVGPHSVEPAGARRPHRQSQGADHARPYRRFRQVALQRHRAGGRGRSSRRSRRWPGEKGVAPAQVALAWLLQQKGVVAPIVGASKPQHLEDALGAIKVKLSEAEMKRLTEPYVPHAVAGHS